ncbi:hypothetical protein [Mesobacillus harenae]|uniref:hypothetical protein n=1 Tax=Mesobacillus harenae TaxID=2213203 RepID=UPI00157FC181|nr:hypothetical protein [Mesobacillus harenae]
MDETLKKLVSEVLSRSGSSVHIKLETNYPKNRLVGGKYNLGTHTVTLYIEQIKAQCLQIFSSESFFYDYSLVVLAHEIGHAEDGDLANLSEQLDTCLTEIERTRILLKIEENAWEYARNFTSHLNQVFVDTIISESLQPYYKALEMEHIA